MIFKGGLRFSEFTQDIYIFKVGSDFLSLLRSFCCVFSRNNNLCCLIKARCLHPAEVLSSFHLTFCTDYLCTLWGSLGRWVPMGNSLAITKQQIEARGHVSVQVLVLITCRYLSTFPSSVHQLYWVLVDTVQ